MRLGEQWRVVRNALHASFSICAVVGLSSCEMFFGDFVERAAPAPEPDEVECVVSIKCREGDVASCTPGNGEVKWETVQECGRAGCNNATLMCNVCAPNTFQCVEEHLQQCAADGSVWVEQKICAGDTPKCDVTSGQCEPCLVNDTKCKEDDEHTLLECRPMGDLPREWTETSCGSLVCQDNGVEAYCETCTDVGTTGCVENPNGPSNTMRECTAELRWVNVPCSEGAVCIDTACVFNQ